MTSRTFTAGISIDIPADQITEAAKDAAACGDYVKDLTIVQTWVEDNFADFSPGTITLDLIEEEK